MPSKLLCVLAKANNYTNYRYKGTLFHNVVYITDHPS